jgi:hypothetical protein
MNLLKYVFPFCFIISLLASCKSHEVTNEYRDAKTHPSETISKAHKRATKRGKKDFVKNQKKAKKAMNKKNGTFFKMKKRHKA